MSENIYFESTVRFLLPSDLLDYFEINSVRTYKDKIAVHLSEKSIISERYSGQELLSKGFLPEICIQDLLIRDKGVFLYIKQRR